MKVAGVSNFFIPTKFDRIDLSSLQQAVVEKPEPIEKPEFNSYYKGGFGNFTDNTREENIANLQQIFNSMKVEKPNYQYKDLGLSTDRSVQLKYIQSPNTSALFETQV